MSTSTRILLGGATAVALGLGVLVAGAGSAGAAPGKTQPACTQGDDLVVYGGNQSAPYPNVEGKVPGTGYVIANLPYGTQEDWTATLQWRNVVTGASGTVGPKGQGIARGTIDFPQLRTGAGVTSITVTTTSGTGRTLTCSGRIVVL
jgi:hypothetical protein